MIVLTKYSCFIKNTLSTSHADWEVETPQKNSNEFSLAGGVARRGFHDFTGPINENLM